MVNQLSLLLAYISALLISVVDWLHGEDFVPEVEVEEHQRLFQEQLLLRTLPAPEELTEEDLKPLPNGL